MHFNKRRCIAYPRDPSLLISLPLSLPPSLSPPLSVFVSYVRAHRCMCMCMCMCACACACLQLLWLARSVTAGGPGRGQDHAQRDCVQPQGGQTKLVCARQRTLPRRAPPPWHGCLPACHAACGAGGQSHPPCSLPWHWCSPTLLVQRLGSCSRGALSTAALPRGAALTPTPDGGVRMSHGLLGRGRDRPPWAWAWPANLVLDGPAQPRGGPQHRSYSGECRAYLPCLPRAPPLALSRTRALSLIRPVFLSADSSRFHALSPFSALWSYPLTPCPVCPWAARCQG